jgi:hypothetical protein
MMTKNNSVVAVYASHTDAETAIKELQQAGFDMKKLSIVGRDTHTDEHVVGYYNTGDRMKKWGTLGAFWGGIWGWFIRFRFPFDSRGWASAFCRADYWLDNRRAGGRCRGGGPECTRSRFV